MLIQYCQRRRMCSERRLNADCNLMTTASRSNRENSSELPGWGPEEWIKPGGFLAKVCGVEVHTCGGLDCVKALVRQHK